MTAKEYLLQYKHLSARVKVLQAEIESLRADAESISVNLDGLPKGQGEKDKTARIAVQLAEYDSKLQAELSDLWRLRMDIVETLGMLTNEKHFTLLHSKYIAGETWEHIAVDMNITWRYCYMLHGAALIELEKILKQKKI